MENAKSYNYNYYQYRRLIQIFDLQEFFKLNSGNIIQQICKYNTVLLIEKGSGNLTIEDASHTISNKSLITITKGQEYKLDFYNNSTGLVLLFDEKLLAELSSDDKLAVDEAFFLYSFKSKPLELSNSEYNDYLMIINSLNNITEHSDENVNENYAVSMMIKLLLKIEYAKLKAKNKNCFLDLALLNEFNDALIQQIDQSRNVDFYSEHLRITKKKLNSVTKTFLGKTAKEIIKSRIIFDSKKLLLDSNFNIKEIAYNMGFTDPTNFNKFFKKNTLITPLEFRNNCNYDHFNHK